MPKPLRSLLRLVLQPRRAPKLESKEWHRAEQQAALEALGLKALARHEAPRSRLLVRRVQPAWCRDRGRLPVTHRASPFFQKSFQKSFLTWA
eukprot:8481661-Pyramimonas_sp.AAC.1